MVNLFIIALFVCSFTQASTSDDYLPAKFTLRGTAYVTGVRSGKNTNEKSYATALVEALESAIPKSASGTPVRLDERPVIEMVNDGFYDDALDCIMESYVFELRGDNSYRVGNVATLSKVDDVMKSLIKGRTVAVNVHWTDNLAKADDNKIYTAKEYKGVTKLLVPPENDRTFLIVGYDVTAGTPYWILKGFRGVNWGDDGYIKIKMNDAPECPNCYLRYVSPGLMVTSYVAWDD